METKKDWIKKMRPAYIDEHTPESEISDRLTELAKIVESNSNIPKNANGNDKRLLRI